MQHLSVQRYVVPPKEIPERDTFYSKLNAFRDEIGEPIQRLPTLGFKELDLWVLYKEVVKRNGINSVIARKQWKEVAEALQLPSSCTDSGFRLRLHYKKYLQAFERKCFTPKPSTDLKKHKKLDKMDRASSTVSTESLLTDLAGENSGSSASRASPPPVSHIKKRDRTIRKKKRSAAKPDKRKIVVQESEKPKDEVLKTSPILRPMSSPRQRPRPDPETQNEKDDRITRGSNGIEKTRKLGHANLSVLEAAVAAVDRQRRKVNRVDFSVLDNSTLQRYAKAYHVRQPEDKKELADKVSAHFSATPLRGGEQETLISFIRAIRRS